MEKLNILISSTYYDFSATRESLGKEITSIGHNAILHENKGVFYDPKEHTHTSCVKAVENNCDILIVIVGTRFGGESVQDVFNHVDFDELKKKSNFKDYFKESNKYSITQCECLKAIEKGIPIIPFVEEAILERRQIYEDVKKQGKVNVTDVPYFHDEKENKYAPYIFEFLKFIGHLYENNQIIPFKKTEDIASYLKEYLSAYFKKLMKFTNTFPDDDIELIPQKFPAEKIIDYLFEDSNRKKSIQSVETHIEFDEKGHCKYEATIKVRPIDLLTHYHFQIYSDKEGKIKVEDFRILETPSNIDYIGIKKGTHLRLNLFFKEPQKDDFTVSLKLKIDNYLSNLVDNGKGSLFRSISNGHKEISRIEERLIFPDIDIFKDLRVKIVKHPEDKKENTTLRPTVSGGKKEFRVRFYKTDKSTFRKNTQLDFVLKGARVSKK